MEYPHLNLGSNGFYMACKLSTHADAYPNTLPWPTVPRCPHLTGIPAFPHSSAVAANVGSSRCSHAPMQHAAAHQQAVLHQGVAVDGISPLLFGIKYGLYIIIYIYISYYINMNWRCIPLSEGLYPTYKSNIPIYIWVEMGFIWLVN